MAYKLDLPANVNIHLVIHVSQLRKVIGFVLPRIAAPPTLQTDTTMHLQPTFVLGVRKIGAIVVSRTDFEVLIQWEGMAIEDATWENGLHIIEQFPSFHLEDKVVFWGGQVVIGPSY